MMKTTAFMSSYGKMYKEDPGTDIIKYFKDDGFMGCEADHYGFKVIRNDDPLEKAKELHERMLQEGIECSCYSRGAVLTRPGMVDELKGAVDVAVALGSPILHHTLYINFSVKDLPIWDSLVDKFADAAREVAHYAGERGITCVYENQGFLSHSADRLGEFLAKVDMPNTGINFDIGNAMYGDADPYEFAAKLGSHIKYVHIKDLLVKPFDKLPTSVKGWTRTPLGNAVRPTIIGHGVIDFDKIFTTLLLAGYDGYYSIEHGVREDDNHTSLMESLNNMKAYYESARENLVKRGLIKE
jgi:sugar phosphate isomerase/epimerase